LVNNLLNYPLIADQSTNNQFAFSRLRNLHGPMVVRAKALNHPGGGGA
jgi:hypothetical protein